MVGDVSDGLVVLCDQDHRGPPVEISMAWATVAWPPGEAIAVCNDLIESKYNSTTR